MRGGTASTPAHEFVGLEQPHSSYKVKATLQGATDPQLVRASMTATQSLFQQNRFQAYLLPVAVAAAFLGTSGSLVEEVGQEIGRTTETQTIRIAWPTDDEWFYSPELITPDQVRSLNELLAVPFTDDLGFEYFPEDA